MIDRMLENLDAVAAHEPGSRGEPLREIPIIQSLAPGCEPLLLVGGAKYPTKSASDLKLFDEEIIASGELQGSGGPAQLCRGRVSGENSGGPSRRYRYTTRSRHQLRSYQPSGHDRNSRKPFLKRRSSLITRAFDHRNAAYRRLRPKT
jgi:hypothetical protein